MLLLERGSEPGLLPFSLKQLILACFPHRDQLRDPALVQAGPWDGALPRGKGSPLLPATGVEGPSQGPGCPA